MMSPAASGASTRIGRMGIDLHRVGEIVQSLVDLRVDGAPHVILVNEQRPLVPTEPIVEATVVEVDPRAGQRIQSIVCAEGEAGKRGVHADTPVDEPGRRRHVLEVDGDRGRWQKLLDLRQDGLRECVPVHWQRRGSRRRKNGAVLRLEADTHEEADVDDHISGDFEHQGGLDRHHRLRRLVRVAQDILERCDVDGDVLRHLGLEPRNHSVHFEIIGRNASVISLHQAEILLHVVDEGVGAEIDPVQDDVDRTAAVDRIEREGPGKADLAL
jgi:hypothetical protein